MYFSYLPLRPRQIIPGGPGYVPFDNPTRSTFGEDIPNNNITKTQSNTGKQLTKNMSRAVVEGEDIEKSATKYLSKTIL